MTIRTVGATSRVALGSMALVILPVYLFLPHGGFRDPWQGLTAMRRASTRVWQEAYVVVASMLARPAVVALGVLTGALSNTVLQRVVWWLPGAQFSFDYHWTPVGSRTVSWTLGYTPLLATFAAAPGLWMADHPPWHAPHGEAP